MNALLPDRLKEIWERVDTGELTAETAQQWQESLLELSTGRPGQRRCFERAKSI